MMTTANTTPSLAANASGGCFSVLDNGDDDDGQHHPIPCCKREWGVYSFCSGQQQQQRLPPPPPSLEMRVGGVLLLFWATTTTTATSTPSLAPNMSGGVRLFSVATGTPPPSFYSQGETLHIAPMTRSGIGCHCHPLPRSKREQRVSCFILGNYGHSCPLPRRVIPTMHPSHCRKQLLVGWIKGATGTQERHAPLSHVNRESSLFPCPLALSARGRVIPNDL
jgi:hypothetical protein